MHRRNLWSVAGAALATSALLLLGGSAGGGDLGRMVGGYGLLLLVGGVYLVAALAIRDRVWRRLPTTRRPGTRPLPSDLHARRIF